MQKNAIKVEVVDLIAFIEDLDRGVRILKMDIEGAEWEIMQRLIDHPVLSRIGCVFVETHERQDPTKYIPLFNALKTREEQIKRPYINFCGFETGILKQMGVVASIPISAPV